METSIHMQHLTGDGSSKIRQEKADRIGYAGRIHWIPGQLYLLAPSIHEQLKIRDP